MTRETMSKLDLLREQLDEVSVEKLEERASDLMGLSEEEQLDLTREAMPGETDLLVLRRMLQKVRGEKTDDEEGEDDVPHPGRIGHDELMERSATYRKSQKNKGEQDES